MEPNTKKRKRGEVDEKDPKLQEFLETMQPSSRRRKEGDLEGKVDEDDRPMIIPEDASDDEYEAVPKRSFATSPPAEYRPPPTTRQNPSTDTSDPPDVRGSPETAGPLEQPRDVNATDDEWLRSRTSRLLDILDPDEESAQQAKAETTTTHTTTEEPGNQADEAVDHPVQETSRKNHKADEDVIGETCRLFVRNLSYSTSEEDVREYFETFGALDEVRRGFFSFLLFLASPAPLLHDEPLIGTAYTMRYLMRSRDKYFSRCYVF